MMGSCGRNEGRLCLSADRSAVHTRSPGELATAIRVTMSADRPNLIGPRQRRRVCANSSSYWFTSEPPSIQSSCHKIVALRTAKAEQDARVACSLRDTHTIDTNTHEMGSNRNLDSLHNRTSPS